MNKFKAQFTDRLMLLKLSIRLQLGQRFWLLPLAALLWPASHWGREVMGFKAQNFAPVDAQNILIGFVLYCLAIGLGVRIIANEIERRTLEVTYTIPGGAQRVWLSKLAAAALLLLVTEVLLAVLTSILFTSYPLSSLYASFQGAIFYLILAMAMGAWLKSELMAAMVSFGLLFLNLTMTTSRWSPLFNPLNTTDATAYDLLIWGIQNHVGYAFVIIAIAALSFFKVEGTEKMLAG